MFSAARQWLEVQAKRIFFNTKFFPLKRKTAYSLEVYALESTTYLLFILRLGEMHASGR